MGQLGDSENGRRLHHHLGMGWRGDRECPSWRTQLHGFLLPFFMPSGKKWHWNLSALDGRAGAGDDRDVFGCKCHWILTLAVACLQTSCKSNMGEDTSTTSGAAIEGWGLAIRPENVSEESVLSLLLVMRNSNPPSQLSYTIPSRQCWGQLIPGAAGQ